MKQTQLEGSCSSGESSGLLAKLWGASLLPWVVCARACNNDLQPPYLSLQRSELDMTDVWSVMLAQLSLEQWETTSPAGACRALGCEWSGETTSLLCALLLRSTPLRCNLFPRQNMLLCSEWETWCMYSFVAFTVCWPQICKRLCCNDLRPKEKMSCMLIAVPWCGGEQTLRWRWVTRNLGQIHHKFLGEKMNQGTRGQARWGVWGSKGLVEVHAQRVRRSRSVCSLLQWANHGVHFGEKLWDCQGPALPISELTRGGCCDGMWERQDPQCQRE